MIARRWSWLPGDRALDAKPLSLPEPPAVRVAVMKAFCVSGKRVEAGETVTVSEYLATDLAARGRAKRI